MRVVIGILAHNEERRIRGALEDVLGQDIWTDSNHDVSLRLVVNGSTDRTAAVARDMLAGRGIKAETHELERAGKANAWNRLVHAFSPPDTDILLLSDADIRVPQPHAFRALVSALAANPTAVAAVDEPVKDIVYNRQSGAAAWLSASASRLAKQGPPKLCGQLYAARAAALRDIYLPEPMLVEDGFIKAMLLTDGFSKPENIRRLIRVEGIFHVYEAEQGVVSVYRHEKRILFGTLSNLVLFDECRREAAAGRRVGAWLRERTEQDPDWFLTFIRKRLGPGGGRRPVKPFILAPLRQARSVRGSAAVWALPAALARTVLNLFLVADVLRDLRRDNPVPAWSHASASRKGTKG